MRDQGLVTIVDALVTLVILAAASALLIQQTTSAARADDLDDAIRGPTEASRLATVAFRVTVGEVNYTDGQGNLRKVQGISVGELVGLAWRLDGDGPAADAREVREKVRHEVTALAGPGLGTQIVATNEGRSISIPRDAQPHEGRLIARLLVDRTSIELIVWEA